MSVVKSAAINLYDSVSGENHLQTKVSSDRADIQISSVPLYLKGTTVNLQNEGGNAIVDVVETMLATQQSVVDETTARVSAVTAEASARVAADGVLQDAVDDEKSAREAAMVAETSVRVSEEGKLDVKITEEKAARQQAITDEITARSGADTTLQGNIAAEQTSRVAEDGKLQTSLDGEIADRTTAVSDEKDERVAADGVLQDNLDDETTARTTLDTTLRGLISAETASRISEDGKEVTARSDADNALAASIATETNARLAEVAAERARLDAMLAGTSIDLNQLQELVTAYTTSDASILAQIGAITTNISAIQSQLDGTDSALNTLIANIQATGAAPAYTHDIKAILDAGLSSTSTGGTGYVLSSYTRVFSVGALSHTNSDVFYVKGVNATTSKVEHRAIFYDEGRSMWALAANYNDFVTNSAYTNASATVYQFATNGQPSNIVEHGAF